MSDLDRAIEAAAEALSDGRAMWLAGNITTYELALLAVEAAAPHLGPHLSAKEQDRLIADVRHWSQRAERAEAEVARLARDLQMSEGDWRARAQRAEAEAERLRKIMLQETRWRQDACTAYHEERALSDRLAEALRFYQHAPVSSCDHCKALAAWEEARRG